jgi:hypothetical protein
MLVPRPSANPLGHGLPTPWQMPHLPPSLGLALGFVAGAVTTILAWMIGAGHDPAVGLLLLTAAAAMVGALTTPIGALVSCDSGCITLFLIGHGVRWIGGTDCRPAG